MPYLQGLNLRRRPGPISGGLVVISMFMIVIAVAAPLIRQLYRSTERITSVALLASNRSPEQQAVEQGLAQQFWRVPTFRFLAPGSVHNVEEARHERVRAMLETTVTVDGGLALLKADLREVKTGMVVWTREYRQPRPELPQVVGLLFNDLCDRLQLELTAKVRQTLAKPPSSSVDAYVAWAKARPHQDLAGLEEAVRLDPDFSLAQGDLAEAYLNRGDTDQARRAAESALRRDPACASARATLARLAALRWDWPQSRAEFQAGLDAVPGDPNLHREYATAYLLPTMQIIEARSDLEKALATDPSRAEIHADLARAFYATHDFANAAEAANEALRLDPHSAAAHFVLAGCAHHAGNKEEEQRQGASVMAAGDGPYSRMLQIRERADAGDKASLVSLLDKGLAEHAVWLPVAVTSPEMDPFQADPRVVAIRQAAGFR